MSTWRLGGVRFLRPYQVVRVICCLTLVAIVLLIFVKEPGLSTHVRGYFPDVVVPVSLVVLPASLRIRESAV